MSIRKGANSNGNYGTALTRLPSRRKVAPSIYRQIQDTESEEDNKVISAEEFQLEEAQIAQATAAPTDPTCYFRDGKRKIDFVIVWEEDLEGDEISESETTMTLVTSQSAAEQGTLDKDAPKDNKPANKQKEQSKESAKKAKWRQIFLRNLRKKVQLEEETKKVANEKIIHYIKMHCPFDVLCYYAEHLSFRAPLQAYPNSFDNFSATMMRKFRVPNFLQQELPRYPLNYYTCQFKNSKFSRFLGSDNKSTFFTETQRQRVGWEILCETVYGLRRRAQIGIERLLEEEVFTAAYPLHCGPCDPEEADGTPIPDEKLNGRQVLRKFWGGWNLTFKYQPLDHIRAYFGEQIGLYFAWLGFYTAWLLPASIIGVLVFLYGCITLPFDSKSAQICAPEAKNLTMCPQCDACKTWSMQDTCLYSRLSYLFDHPGTVFYATLISLWAVFFLEFWKRTNADLAHRWDCTEFQDEEESIRPKYAALAPTNERNPITGIIEPHFPDSMRIPRIISAVVAIALMIALVLIFIVAVILYRVIVNGPLFQIEAIRSQSQLIANFSAAIVNLVLIMALSKVYELLAFKLTEWEMHRTQSAFDDALISKGFLFQFVNFYSSIIYIGFFKGKFVGYPGHYNSFLGLRPEECGNGSCLVELAQQLGVIMIGKQLIGNVQEILVPKLKTLVHRFKVGGLKSVFGKETVRKPRWEEDYEMIENEGLFDEYLEMVLQFGFITIFVAAFPLAPLFALLNNWAEIRLDAQKLVCETRRPVAQRAQDIGIWFAILEILTRLAVISNAFLIAFTSDFLPQLVYKAENEGSLDGYLDHSLAHAPNGTTTEPCRYLDYRDEKGHLTPFYYKVLIVRLAFVIVFEHVVFSIQRLIDLAVPDIPEKLQLKIKREKYLARQALADTDEIDRLVTDVNSRRTSIMPPGSLAPPLKGAIDVPEVVVTNPTSDGGTGENQASKDNVKVFNETTVS